MDVVLFGTGAIAREHVRAIRALQADDGGFPARLRGVYSPRPFAAAAFATEHELPASTDEAQRFLDDPTVDTVIICSPSALHVPQTRAALAAGKHVLCEIPLALSLAEAIELRDLAERQRRTLMIAHTLRFQPTLQAVRAQIAQGLLHPTAIVARYLFLRRANAGWTGQQRSWTDNLLWHHGGHAVDTCLWLLGADHVDAVSHVAPPDPELGIPLDLSVIVRANFGALATIAMSYNSAVYLHDYTIIGQETTLRASPTDVLWPDGRPFPVIDRNADPLVAQNRAFFTAAHRGDAAPVGVNDILPSLTVLQQVADAAGLVPSTEERDLAETERVLLDARFPV